VKTPALMTRSERTRYQRFLAAADERIAREHEHIGQLRTRFHLAVTIDDAASTQDVAVMYSQVCVRDLRTGRTRIETVALPPDGEVLATRRPLSSWAGPVLLGARKGDELQWLSGGLLERLRIEKVLHQPGVAVPALVRSAPADRKDEQPVSATAFANPASAERNGRVRWLHYP